MNGIPKGLCSFGGVTPHKMGRCPKDRGDVPVKSEAAPLVAVHSFQRTAKQYEGAPNRSEYPLSATLTSPCTTGSHRKGEFQKHSGLFWEEGDSPRGGEMSQRDRGDGPD